VAIWLGIILIHATGVNIYKMLNFILLKSDRLPVQLM
jgi:hypothetical protein